jgi:transposase-like protein
MKPPSKFKGHRNICTAPLIARGIPWTFCSVPKRDAKAAKRFFKKVLKGAWTEMPRGSNGDQNPAYPSALKDLKADKTMPEETELRQVKYLNNLIKQVYRLIKRRTNPGLGFGPFNIARRTI